MWKSLIAAVLVVVLPASVSAGPLRDSAERAGREAVAQAGEKRDRTRFWSGIALIAGGGVLAALGGFEIGDDESGPDDGEDMDNSDDGEDSDGWGNKALIGSGIAAAAVGGVLLFTGRNGGPVLSVRPGRATLKQTIRF